MIPSVYLTLIRNLKRNLNMNSSKRAESLELMWITYAGNFNLTQKPFKLCKETQISGCLINATDNRWPVQAKMWQFHLFLMSNMLA